LPDKAVSEARERVRSAMIASGLALPARRITINLAPADLPKEGSHYDLPIALGLMAAIGAIPHDALPDSPFWASLASTARSRRSPAFCRPPSAPTRAAKD
jgi:predicted ATPase with chaperone activity